MLAKQRYNKILELLDKDGIVHTAELVKLMGVSSETVRKDLEYLDNQGRLSRVHGGAVPVDNGTTPDMPGGYISLQIRNSQHLEQKSAITAKAASIDVYKRQIIYLAHIRKSWPQFIQVLPNQRRRHKAGNLVPDQHKIPCRIIMINPARSVGQEQDFRPHQLHKPDPVSYTHLDVYKRQL